MVVDAAALVVAVVVVVVVVVVMDFYRTRVRSLAMLVTN